MDGPQLTSARFSQRTNLVLMPLVYAHWVLGSLAEYEQNMALYSVFTILNGWLGFFVFFLHCGNNQAVSFFSYLLVFSSYYSWFLRLLPSLWKQSGCELD